MLTEAICIDSRRDFFKTRRFATVSMIIGIPIAVWGAFYLLTLPILAYFGVRVVRKRQIGPDKTVALARSMKQAALRYAALMDKLIDQEKA